MLEIDIAIQGIGIFIWHLRRVFCSGLYRYHFPLISEYNS